MQSLVRPAEEVSDFRTAVTGHTAADLESVRYSLEDAQRDVLGALETHQVGDVSWPPRSFSQVHPVAPGSSHPPAGEAGGAMP